MKENITILDRIRLLFMSKRSRQRYLRMAAIDIARGKESRLNGARVVKDFEKVNHLNLDPNSQWHIDTIRDMARYKALIIGYKEILGEKYAM